MMCNLHKALEMRKECPNVKLPACLALCVAPALSATEAYTATTTTGRPLLEVATELEARYHWRVNYEDPPLENPSELKDLTHPLYRASHPDPQRRLACSPGKAIHFLVGGFGFDNRLPRHDGPAGKPAQQLRQPRRIPDVVSRKRVPHCAVAFSAERWHHGADAIGAGCEDFLSRSAA